MSIPSPIVAVYPGSWWMPFLTDFHKESADTILAANGRDERLLKRKDCSEVMP